MIYAIRYLDEAIEDIARLKRSEPQAHKKLLLLLDELSIHPKTGTGHPKPLSGNRASQWSRKIDKKHRLVYQIEEDIVLVLVLSAMGHYDDK
jgi:toxin YoeB